MARSSISPLGALIAEIRDERVHVVAGPPPAEPSTRSWRWPVSLALHAALVAILVAPAMLRSDATPSAPAPTVTLAATAPALARPAAAPTTPTPPVTPVRVGGDIKKPTKLRHVDPVYPATAAAAKAQGTVTLECVVSPQGRVTGVKVVSGVPLLDAAAVDAVRQWAFTPTLRHRVAVPVIVTVAVQFGREDVRTHAARIASEM